MYAFNCHFFSHLRRTVVARQNEKNLYTMISKFHHDKIFEAYDCLVIPIHCMNGNHWCIVYIDVWKQSIYYYDPMQKGMQDVTATKLYFNLLYEFRSYEVDVASKRFITAFDVCWESMFPMQNGHSSCGIYVLLYASSKLGLLNVDPMKNSMREIRKTIAVELYTNEKYIPVPKPFQTEKDVRECSIPNRYKQRLGKRVVLRCKANAVRCSTST